MSCQLDKGGEQITVSVSGPAEKLAVIMADPKGEKTSQTIEKERMMTNTSSVQFRIVSFENNGQQIQPGTYSFVLKRFDPEKILEEVKFPLLLNRVEIKDFEVRAKKIGQEGGLAIKSISFSIEKDGNCPVIFNGVDVFADDTQCRCPGNAAVVVGPTNSVCFELDCPVSRRKQQEYDARAKGQSMWSVGLPPLISVFGVGEKCTIKGKLCYGGGKSLEFGKEITFTSEDLRNAAAY